MGLRNRFRLLLKKKGWYYPFKYSKLFGVYESLFKPHLKKDRKRELDFYRSFLPACKLVFDIGANDGHKAEAFLHFSAMVVCCEPDPENQEILKARFRSAGTRIRVEKLALSDKPGRAELHIHHPASAFNTLSRKWKKLLEDEGVSKWQEEIKFSRTETIETTTLDHLIVKYGVPDFIKIDVEGWEEPVLRGLSQAVTAISFETLLPEYVQEFNSCLNKLEMLSGNYKFNLGLKEKMLLSEFVSRSQLETWLENNPQHYSFEVIAKLQP